MQNAEVGTNMGGRAWHSGEEHGGSPRASAIVTPDASEVHVHFVCKASHITFSHLHLDLDTLAHTNFSGAETPLS
jgi:hypothetical protein